MKKNHILFVRADDRLRSLLDARVTQLRKDMPGRRISTADVVRDILYAHLLREKEGKWRSY